MDIKFDNISKYNRGTLFHLLRQAYSFHEKWEHNFSEKWRESDNFLFDNLQIADKYGFVTRLNEEPIGYAIYDPRHLPEYAIVGDNCIIPKYKGMGYGLLQMQELINRIKKNDVMKIYVSTNLDLIPAQHMYERVGFVKLENSTLEQWQIEQNCECHYSMTC
jgi:ribosomal protein S18 acetylase RimI-like enzyme